MTVTTIDKQSHDAALSQQGLSLAEWHVLSMPGKWPLPAENVPTLAASHSIGDRRGAVSETECQAALNQLKDKGLVQVVDGRRLAELGTKLQEQAAGPPVYDLPQIGDVDFTDKGAEVFRALSRDVHGPDWFSDAVVESEDHSEKTIDTTRIEKVIEARTKAEQGCFDIRVTKTGPWCIYWWKAFPSGWRIDLKKKMEEPVVDDSHNAL